MKDPEREFKNGEVVLVTYGRHIYKLQMIVVDATLCLKGWRYKLGFQKKDGTVDKRREHWYFFAKNHIERKIDPVLDELNNAMNAGPVFGRDPLPKDFKPTHATTYFAKDDKLHASTMDLETGEVKNEQITGK